MNIHIGDATPDQEDVRDGLEREMTRRWVNTAREVKRSIMLHDALGIGDKAPQSAMPTGDKAEMFRRWLNERLSVGVGGYDGSWLETFVNRASTRGAALGDAQAGLAFLLPSGPAPSSKACHRAAVGALAGVCEDVSGRAHESVARGLLVKAKPRQIARLVDQAMGHGLKRSRALAEHSVTQAFTQATLDALEASGVTHVGTVSERRRRSRLKDADITDGLLFDASISLDAFDPDEPRDEHGRWSPTKTVTAYKLFEKRGEALHPLFIGSKNVVPQGQWLKAVFDPTKGYAPRPGWHAGVDPIAPHLRTKAGKIAASRVWAEVELPADKDYQAQAEASGTHDIRGHVPEGGFYRFKTNKMQGGAWMIGGALKVNKVLSDPEVRELLTKKGYAPHEIAGEMHDGLADDWFEDAPRNTPQPKHPRSGRFAKAHVVAREMRRSKRTGRFRKQGFDPVEQRKEELAEARFGRVEGKLDILTAGDDRVCDVCDGISENGPYTINEARGLIPAHPNCRCVFVAAGTMQDAVEDEPRDERGRWTDAGVVAYHGSAADFTRFDLAHMGSGEGSTSFGSGYAADYGYGLYLAGAPETARKYQEETSQRKSWADPVGGNLYQVRIHAKPEEFLDWDKPLSAQPQAVRDLVGGRVPPGTSGAHLMQGWIGMGPKGSGRLAAAGIKGVRYLDQLSRAKGAGASNYVVFDPSIIEVTHKNGVALLDFDPSEPRDPLGMWTKTEGITAYHGSGHDFAQFAMEHVGEGEGSQAYGHGLYLAEEPQVAEGYKTMGASGFPGIVVKGRFKPQTELNEQEKNEYANVAAAGATVDASIKGLGTAIDQVKFALGSDVSSGARSQGEAKLARLEKTLTIARRWKDEGIELAPISANLYQVKIHATPDEFLDWDKPLSQQSKLVQDYVQNRDLGAAYKKRAPGVEPIRFDPSGEQMMRGFIGMGPKGAERLRAAGIKGVRYLDQGSRLFGDSQKMVENYGTREKALEAAQDRYKKASLGDILYWQKRVDELSKKPTHNYVIVDPGIIEITHHNGKPLTKAEARDALVRLLADFDPDEPRDETGKWTSSGSVTPSLVHAGGEEFVSPSVELGLTFAGAKAALGGQRQAAMLKVSDEIDGALGLKETARSVIGAWADGAENSVLATLPQASWDEIRLSAAMKGYVGDQKAVLAFKQDDNGDAFMYEMHAKGALDDIHHRLLNDGLQFHTLAPTADGADVYVADLDGKATEAIQKAAEDFHANATYQRGRAEFIGTQQETGSDRAIRDDARRNYEEVVQQSPVSRGQEVWRRNRDRWSSALAGVRAKALVGKEQSPAISGVEAEVELEASAMRGRQAWGKEVTDRVKQQFDADGYPQRHMEVLSGPSANMLAGGSYNTLAQYSPQTGKIQVFSNVIPKTAEAGSGNTVEGIVAHEIQHAKTDWWMKQNPAIEEKLKDKIRLSSKLMDQPLDIGHATPRELMTSDGVSPYSQHVWDQWNDSQDRRAPLPFDIPFGETISELRAIERETGKLPGAIDGWGSVYRAIEAEWQRGHEKTGAAKLEVNPRLRPDYV